MGVLHARSLRFPGKAMTLVIAAAAAVPALSGGAPPPVPQRLEVGAALVRQIGGGEAHGYRVEARPGKRLLATVDQRGIDLVVEVLAPDGRTLIAVDSPTDSQGPES